MNDFDLKTNPDDAAAPIEATEWHAMQFVLGELPADEMGAFEARLADDQNARDAVVRATQLVQTIASTRPVAPPHTRNPIARYWRRIAVFASGLAALLLIGLLVGQLENDKQRRTVVTNDVDPARLVVLWSESSGTLNGYGDTDASEEPSTVDSDSVLLPPDWLLAAVEHDLPVDPSAGMPVDPGGEAIERN